jgi:hypothetical protein
MSPLAKRVSVAVAVLAVTWPLALLWRTFGDGSAPTALAAVAAGAAVFALGAVLYLARRARPRTLAPTLVALAVAAAFVPVIALGSIALAWLWSVLFGAVLAWAAASGVVSLVRAGRVAVRAATVRYDGDDVVEGRARVVEQPPEALPR